MAWLWSLHRCGELETPRSSAWHTYTSIPQTEAWQQQEPSRKCTTFLGQYCNRFGQSWESDLSSVVINRRHLPVEWWESVQAHSFQRRSLYPWLREGVHQCVLLCKSWCALCIWLIHPSYFHSDSSNRDLSSSYHASETCLSHHGRSKKVL